MTVKKKNTPEIFDESNPPQNVIDFAAGLETRTGRKVRYPGRPATIDGTGVLRLRIGETHREKLKLIRAFYGCNVTTSDAVRAAIMAFDVDGTEKVDLDRQCLAELAAMNPILPKQKKRPTP